MLLNMDLLQYYFLIFFVQIVHSTNELEVITKLPRNTLMKYSSYSNVMILHFNIPYDTTKAIFKFQAKDEPASIFVRNCDARDVSVVMKSGSYPVINPDGVPFPTTFLNNSRPPLYDINFKTNMKVNYINLTSPVPGNWFAVAFISWTDPKNDRIEQQGLSSRCEANLFAECLIERKQNITILTSNIPSNITLQQTQPQLFKFYVPEDIDSAEIIFKLLTPCKSCEDVLVMLRAKSIPNEKNYSDKLLIKQKSESEEIEIFPEENGWHYLNISVLESKSKNKKEVIEFEFTLKFKSAIMKQKENPQLINIFYKTSLNKFMTLKKQSLEHYNYRQYNMMRLTGAENFMFEYDFQPDENGSTPILLNITNRDIAVLKFQIYDIIDIGGTLTIGLAVKPGPKLTRHLYNYTVVTCIHKDMRYVPQYPNNCVYDDINIQSPFILNSTNAGTLKFVHIPYPDPGTWYMSMRVFYDDCIPCVCTSKCEELYDKCFTECSKKCNTCNCSAECKEKMSINEDCVACNCDGICQKLNGTDNRNVSMIFSISSHPCITGRCGKFGKCNHYMAGGFIFSSCQCFGGYRGWDCSDGSQARSEAEILTSILLLTLSNLLFIASVYFAFKRRYYTECVVYFFTMFFSTFYHACDSEENMYGFCLVRLGVLQFCDFYCGLLSIWVTLIAMSFVHPQLVSICHVGGAILLSFGTIYNKQALWVFLMPAITGVIIIVINWGFQCYKKTKLFPARKYFKIYMPIGLLLVLMGLVSFAFLQTKENYKIVHSLWHIIMALSVIFLLPSKENFVSNN